MSFEWFLRFMARVEYRGKTGDFQAAESGALPGGTLIDFYRDFHYEIESVAYA
jgi:hypothetical protein